MPTIMQLTDRATMLNLRNIKVFIEPGMIPGYENIRVEITDPDSGKTVIVDCFDGPAPCVALEHHTGKTFDVVFADNGEVGLY